MSSVIDRAYQIVRTRECGVCDATIENPAEGQTVCYQCLGRPADGRCDWRRPWCGLDAEHHRRITQDGKSKTVGVCETHRREIERSSELEMHKHGK